MTDLVCVSCVSEKTESSSSYIPKEIIPLNYLPGREVNHFFISCESHKLSIFLPKMRKIHDINKKNISKSIILISNLLSKKHMFHDEFKRVQSQTP